MGLLWIQAFVGWWEIMQQSREDRRVLSVVEAHKEFRRTICANAADVLARLRLKSFQVLVLRSWWWCIKFCQCQQRLANHQELQAARFSHRRVFVAWRSTSRLLKGEDADQVQRLP